MPEDTRINDADISLDGEAGGAEAEAEAEATYEVVGYIDRNHYRERDGESVYRDIASRSDALAKGSLALADYPFVRVMASDGGYTKTLDRVTEANAAALLASGGKPPRRRRGRPAGAKRKTGVGSEGGA